MKLKHRLIPIIGLLLLTACTNQQPRYIIGVSQCSDDIWREKQNAELRMDTYFHENVELRFATAYDSDERQVQQIDSLVATGINLLIVAPNQVATISPAIDRAYDQGIPVIVFERKTSSKKYTAFMSADNHEMGRLMGEYIAGRLNGHGKVLQIMGLKGSSPAIERDKGFREAISQYPQIELVATLQGDWTEQSAYDAVKAYKGDLSGLDFVFGQNDRMALGARKALSSLTPNPSPLTPNPSPLTPTKYCGIDGLPGEDGGIACVRDGILDATYIYPTHGDQLMDLALAILQGQPYEKEVQLKSALVTADNANVLLMQNEELVRQARSLEELHERADSYLQQIDAQRIIVFLAIGFIALLLAVIASIYFYFVQRARIHQERVKMEREQLDFYTQVAHELRTPLTLIQGPLEQLDQVKKGHETSDETLTTFAILKRNTNQLTEIINKMLDVQANAGVHPSGIPSAASVIPSAVEGSQSAVEGSQEISPRASLSRDDKASELDTATVLIVDDNADIRTYLRSILQEKYQVNEAADGQQGLALANEIVPDLIVSDVMMPVMNGLEFCQRVKGGTATSHIPIILLTARALSQHQIEGYESGADAYITKPFSAEVLLARISNLLKSRHQLKNLFASAPQDDATVATPTSDISLTTNPLPLTPKEDSFMLKFRDFIESNMGDSDLNVETIGAELGLSRVQLYRKVKALTGQSPVELLRTARLQRGRELLKTTDKNVSEVAYEVGFTAPSYFTKCFKDEFGISPSDL